ncbi:hypothetical protein BgiMline_026542, partial [Biomphalaria glabrata]
MKGGHVEVIHFPGSTNCEELMEPCRANCSLEAEVEAAHKKFEYPTRHHHMK